MFRAGEEFDRAFAVIAAASKLKQAAWLQTEELSRSSAVNEWFRRCSIHNGEYCGYEEIEFNLRIIGNRLTTAAPCTFHPCCLRETARERLRPQL
jgi:hypothetical protein